MLETDNVAFFGISTGATSRWFVVPPHGDYLACCYVGGGPHVALDWQNRLKSLIQKLCKLATTACLLSCATDYMANILKLFAVAYGETVKQLRHKNHMKKAMISPQSHFSLQVLRLRGNGLKSFFFLLPNYWSDIHHISLRAFPAAWYPSSTPVSFFLSKFIYLMCISILPWVLVPWNWNYRQ